MKKLLLSLAVAAMSATAFAGQVQDVLTVSNFKTADGKDLEVNSYVVATYTSATTGITYTIQGCKTKASYGEGLQFRSKNNNSGLVITANPKGATFKSAAFKACSGPTTNNTMEFYGNTTAYSNPTDLYGENKGTSIGTLKQNETAAMNASADYNFIGMRSTNGAVYIETITFTYEIAGVTGKKAADLAFSEKEVTITEGDAFTAPTLTKATNAEVVYSTSDENVADVNATTGAVTIMGVGEAVISAKAAENDEYYAGEASYKIIVKEKLAAGTVVLLDATAADGTEGWTLEANNLPEGLSYVWKWKVYNGSGYLNGSAYVGGSANTIDACYAISPAIDLSSYKSASFKYESAAKFQTTLKTLCGVAVREEGATEWTSLEVTTWPEAGGWTWGWSNDFDLTPYVGKKIQIGYKYGSSSAGADTWEIRNLTITGETGGVDVVENFVDDNNAPVVYYNMQGMKVANPTEGMYIRVQGSKSTKVMIRK